MAKKPKVDSDSIFYTPESSTEQSNIKHIFSKYDYELFDEEKNKPYGVFQVKRIANAKGTVEKWKILNDEKEVAMLNGIYLNKHQKEFLRSPKGILFLIDYFKHNKFTIKEVKKAINSNLESLDN